MQKHTPLPTRSNRRHRANFARQVTIDAFGWRFARALDQADFVDRLPGDLPRPSPEAQVR
jgi:hypothetical protein